MWGHLVERLHEGLVTQASIREAPFMGFSMSERWRARHHIECRLLRNPVNLVPLQTALQSLSFSGLQSESGQSPDQL